MHWNLVLDFLGFVALGMFAGVLSGLMGAGGGLITVPGLAFLFRLEGMTPSIIMHIAVGTTLAKMIFVASRSLMSHLKRQIPFFYIYKRMVPGLVVGVIVGGTAAHFIHSYWLRMIFGCYVLLMAGQMLWHHKKAAKKTLPGSLGLWSAGAFVGLQSGFLGIGGSAFTVPFLTQRGISIRTAVVVSVAFAVSVATIGAGTFIATGLHAVGLPHWSLGYIYGPAWVGVTLGGIVMAPLGARLSHYLPPEKLKRYFAVFLIVVGAHMLVPF